jgi:hypothetical protein
VIDWSNAHIKTYYPQLVGSFTKYKTLNDYFDQIHFKNSFSGLAEGKFKRRVVGEHFITYFLDYNYEAPTKKEMAAMRVIEFKDQTYL